jgi:hypothetical protein
MDRNERIKAMLAPVDKMGDDVVKNALRTLSTVAAKIAMRKDDDNDNDGDEGADNVMDALTTLVDHVSQNEEITSDQAKRLYYYEVYLDRDLPKLISEIENMVTDRISALNAIKGFNISYFRNLPMSVTAKQSLAATLRSLCQRYAHDENGFWLNLMNGNSEAMDSVAFHINTSSIEENS